MSSTLDTTTSQQSLTDINKRSSTLRRSVKSVISECSKVANVVLKQCDVHTSGVASQKVESITASTTDAALAATNGAEAVEPPKPRSRVDKLAAAEQLPPIS